MSRKKTAKAAAQGAHPMRTKIDFRLLAGGIAALACGIFAIDLLLPVGVAIGVLYTTLVLLSMWSPHRWFILLVAAAVSVLAEVGFFLSPGDPNWMAVSNRLLSLFTIWVATVLALLHKRDQEECERLIHDLQDSLDHIKTLRGLLPVCVSCKKVHNGQGYWKSLDAYVAEHSEAQITHGICPDCFTHYYPKTAETSVQAK
jgi:hypothetical protein